MTVFEITLFEPINQEFLNLIKNHKNFKIIEDGQYGDRLRKIIYASQITGINYELLENNIETITIV